MKLLLLALLITLNTAFSSSIDSRWLQAMLASEEEALLEEEASLGSLLSDIQANPFLNDIFNFGLQGVISRGISRGRVPNTTFHAVSVYDWNEEALENGEEFTFTAVAVSDDGNSVIDMTFNVHYDVITQEKTLGAYGSKTTTTLGTTTPETPQTPPVTPGIPTTVVIITSGTTEEYQNEEVYLEENNEEVVLEVNLLFEIEADPVLNDIFTFGVNGVIASGISRGRIPNTTFNPVRVSDWSKKTDSNGEWYTFSAIAVSEDGTSVVETTFTVLYSPTTNEKTLRSYSSKTTTTTSTTRQGLNEEEVTL